MMDKVTSNILRIILQWTDDKRDRTGCSQRGAAVAEMFDRLGFTHGAVRTSRAILTAEKSRAMFPSWSPDHLTASPSPRVGSGAILRAAPA